MQCCKHLNGKKNCYLTVETVLIPILTLSPRGAEESSKAACGRATLVPAQHLQQPRRWSRIPCAAACPRPPRPHLSHGTPRPSALPQGGGAQRGQTPPPGQPFPSWQGWGGDRKGGGGGGSSAMCGGCVGTEYPARVRAGRGGRLGPAWAWRPGVGPRAPCSSRGGSSGLSPRLPSACPRASPCVRCRVWRRLAAKTALDAEWRQASARGKIFPSAPSPT